MPRPILDEAQIHPAICERVADHVRGVLVGGADDVAGLIASRDLASMLA